MPHEKNIHYGPGGALACNRQPDRVLWRTENPEKVTCASCQRTGLFKEHRTIATRPEAPAGYDRTRREV